MQAIRAACEAVKLVGQLQQHQGHAHGHHQAREVGTTNDHRAGDGPQHGAARDGHKQAHQGVGHHMLGKQRGAISAQAKKGGVAQRDDARKTQDQVK